MAKYTGAKTGLAGLVTAALVGITLLCLTPVFNAMPMNALAAIVIAGVLPLLDFGKGVSLFWVCLHSSACCCGNSDPHNAVVCACHLFWTVCEGMFIMALISLALSWCDCICSEVSAVPS